MKSLEKAFNFLMKNYWIFLPMIIAKVIPAFIFEGGAVSLSQSIQNILLRGSELGIANDTQMITKMFAMLGLVSIGSFTGFILQIIATPIVFGMIKKGLLTGNTGMDDFVPALKGNFLKYLLYIIVRKTMALIICVFFVMIAMMGILSIFNAAWEGLILMGAFSLILFIIIIMLGLLAPFLTLWFPAMVLDDCSLFDGLKKSINIVKSKYLTILGINVLMGMVSIMFGTMISAIPFRTVFSSIISSLIAVVLYTFYMIIYFDEGKLQHNINDLEEHINQDAQFYEE